MDHELFANALGLSESCFVEGLGFDERGRRLTMHIDLHGGPRHRHRRDVPRPRPQLRHRRGAWHPSSAFWHVL